jgi:cellulose synthase (UDP-forming)
MRVSGAYAERCARSILGLGLLGLSAWVVHVRIVSHLSLSWMMRVATESALALLLVLAQLLLLPRLRRDDQLVRRTLLVINAVLLGRYLLWRLLYTLPPFQWTASALTTYAFCIFEILMAVVLLRNQRVLARPIRRSREATEHRLWFAARPPRVAVLIATYNESADIISRTIVGATSLDYPNYTTWVLDDGHRDWLKERCSSLAVGYLARSDNRGYKSGNLNNALNVLRHQEDPPDFIAVFDADFVPRVDFLTRLMPLMRDERVALAQTPQFYFNPDPFQYAFRAHAVWPDDTRAYFEGALPCLDGAGSSDCCGTSFVARCSAIEQIGGFATESVSDDTLTGVKLQQAGYRVVCLDERLSSGLATEGLQEFLAQRGRWSLGNVQIALSEWGPAANARGLRRLALRAEGFRQSLLGLLFWLWTFLPALYFFTGFSLVPASTNDMLSYALPLIAMWPAFLWMRVGVVLPVISDPPQVMSSLVAFKAAWQALFHPKKRNFTITAKGAKRDGYVVHWRYFVPLAALMAVTIVGLMVNTVASAAGSGGDSHGWIAALAMARLVTLYIACFVCIERPKRRSSERFETRSTVRFQAGDLARPALLLDLSESGCLVSCGGGLEPGAACTVGIDRVGTLAGRIVRIAKADCYGIAFALSSEEASSLQRELYCTDNYIRLPRRWTFWRAMRPLALSLRGLS